jgi:hypothetical protein
MRPHRAPLPPLLPKNLLRVREEARCRLLFAETAQRRQLVRHTNKQAAGVSNSKAPLQLARALSKGGEVTCYTG